MPKALKENAIEVVENYNKSDTFDMEATIVCHSKFMVVFQSISADLPSIDTNFPLENLLCMKDFLALQAREVEEEDSSDESLEASHSSYPKGAPEAKQLDPPLPSNQPPH